jgi:hypothetical protein
MRSIYLLPKQHWKLLHLQIDEKLNIINLKRMRYEAGLRRI